LSITVAALVISLSGGNLEAKVARRPLVEVLAESEFVGVIRVDRVSGIPWLTRRTATATVVETWKGSEPQASIGPAR
jgi:hypothetical protein